MPKSIFRGFTEQRVRNLQLLDEHVNFTQRDGRVFAFPIFFFCKKVKVRWAKKRKAKAEIESENTTAVELVVRVARKEGAF